MNNIFVIGVGLIGGSLCLDIKKIYPKVKVYGIDTSSENLDLALKLDLIDYKSSLDVLYKVESETWNLYNVCPPYSIP